MLSPWSAVIFMPCNHVATVRSMLLLSCFSKDDLDIKMDSNKHGTMEQNEDHIVMNIWIYHVHEMELR